ncbi:unnamed protein product [Toxocara canis]|uniref:SRCR domain-containing protein n=1 Tax=Toxocara canis TaxID=6265 RepID=A0A183UPK4_TOXCA|nr:unnamed protein product [Toxocara canis]
MAEREKVRGVDVGKEVISAVSTRMFGRVTDSFEEWSGRKIEQKSEEDIREIGRAEKVKLQSGTAVNLLCGLRDCFTFKVYRCDEGVLVTCKSEEVQCEAGELLVDGRCVSFRDESIRDVSAAELLCQKFGLSLFTTKNKQQMDEIALLARRFAGKFLLILTQFASQMYYLNE